MLTHSAMMRALRQMRAYGELQTAPVPRDRGARPGRDDHGPVFPDAPAPLGPGETRTYRKWDEERGAFLMVTETGPEPQDSAPER